MLDTGLINIINPIAIPPQILWGGFGIAIILTIIMSLVLFYHWHKYGYGTMRMRIATMIYITGIVILIGLMFSSISGYIISI